MDIINVKKLDNSSVEDKPKFKRGDMICYKSHPDVYIGSIASDDCIDCLVGVPRMWKVFTSDDWFKHFAPYGGPNTLSVSEDDIMLYDGPDNRLK